MAQTLYLRGPSGTVRGHRPLSAARGHSPLLLCLVPMTVYATVYCSAMTVTVTLMLHADVHQLSGIPSTCPP